MIIKKELVAYFLLIIAAVIWGIDNTVIKIGLRDIPPVIFTFFRYPITSLLFGAILLYKKLPKTVERKDLPQIALLALFNSVFGMVFINIGLKYTTASNAAIINSVFPPILIALFAWLFLKEKLSLINILGILTSVLGVVFILNIFTGIKELMKSQYFFGNVLIFAGAISWTVYNILGKTIFKKYNAITITAYLFSFSALFLIPFVLWELTRQSFSFPPSSLLAVIYDCIFAGFFAYLFWNKGLKAIPASRVGIFTYVIAISGVITGVIFLKEVLTIPFIIGCVLTFIGLYLTTKN